MTNAELDAASRARAARLEAQRQAAHDEDDPHAGARHLAAAITALAATIGAPAPVALALAPAPAAPREPTLAEFLESRRQTAARAARSRARAEAEASEARVEHWVASQRAESQAAAARARAAQREAQATAAREAAARQAILDEREALRDRLLGKTRAELADSASQQELLRGYAAHAALFAAAADRVPSDPELEAKRKRQMRAGLRLGF